MNIRLLVFLLLIGGVAYSQETIEYGENYIVFEAEATSSDLDKWVKRTPVDPNYYAGTGVEAINQTYLEFTGNNLNGGTPTSPLEYKFIAPKTANYRIVMRMYQPLAPEEEADKRNDVYIKLAGNYSSECAYPKSILETNHKFWGRGVRIWGSIHSMEAHVDGVRKLAKVVYGLIEGEEYTLTMSGRAQGCSIDYILLYEESLNLSVTNIDIAAVNSPIYQPGLGLVDPTSLVIEPTPATIRDGSSYNLEISAEPENARKDVVWSSAEPDVISVDSDGKITAKGSIGESVIITAESVHSDLVATSEVTIVEWYPITVESVFLELEQLEIVEGQSISLTAVIEPINADEQGLIWSSSDENIATVDESGKVTAIGTGTATIRASSVENASIYDELIVDVQSFVEPFVAFDDEGNYLGKSFKLGESIDVSCNYHAGNFATVEDGVKFWLREIKSGWSIANEAFTYVDNATVGTTSGTSSVSIPLNNLKTTSELPGGNFYFLYLTFTNSKGIKVEKGIHPINIIGGDVTNISIEPVSITLDVGEAFMLSTAVEPSNAEDKSLVWESDDPDIATVSGNGEIIGVSSGKTIITATSVSNPTITATAEVIVNEVVLSIDDIIKPVLYPNPVTGEIISLSGMPQGEYVLLIVDQFGKVIRTKKTSIKNNQIESLKIADISNGLYILKINGPNTQKKMRFIIRN
jgi:uncharacterized protein YjdB